MKAQTKDTILCFDFDGVIINNTITGFNRMNLILHDLELLPVSHEFLRARWGMRVNDLCAEICHALGATFGDLERFQEAVKKAHVQQLAIDCRLRDVLSVLSKFGFSLAIITSRDSSSLKFCLNKIGLDAQLFDFIQTISDHDKHKPQAEVFDPLLAWANNHGLAARDITYFGDTIQYDFQAVKNAREQGNLLEFIGVASGVNTVAEFMAAGLNKDDVVTSQSMLSYYLNCLIYQKVR